MQAAVEINKKKEEVKGDLKGKLLQEENKVEKVTNELHQNVANQQAAANRTIEDMDMRMKHAEKESLTE